MKKNHSLYILLSGLFLPILTCAQTPEQNLREWARQHPIEKIYLHFDRDQYAAGETAWFKAYLSSEYLPDTISSNLQVELSGPGQPGLQRIILPVLAGTSAGQLDIPDSLETGMYTVSAYTPSMALESPDFIFKKGIWIHGRKKKESALPMSPAIEVRFFPEGGNLVTGFSGMVAFKASYSNGLPASVKGKIYNSKGEELAVIADEHEGMGVFELKPVAGEKYTAVITEPVQQRMELPEAVSRGISFSLIPHPQGSFFEINQSGGDPAFQSAYMIGQMQHQVVLRYEFPGGKTAYQGVIDTRPLPSGILQLTVFNRAGMPLAERLCFVNNREFLQPAYLLEDTVNLTPRGRNRFRVSIPDTVQGSLSISVTDADMEPEGMRSENILTHLLLTADLPGYVHKPAYYLSGDNDSVRMAADLLMMTHGWRRFRWTEIPKTGSGLPGKQAFISIGGRALLRGSRKPFADKSLLLMINDTQGKKRNTQMLTTGADGNFLIDSLIFFDKKLLLFSDVRGKKSQYINIELRESTFRLGFTWPGSAWIPDRHTPVRRAAGWQAAYDEVARAKGLLLEGVTIKVKKTTPMEQLDERYTTGIFSGESTRAIDLVHSDEALPYINIFDYLQSRVNGLTINSDGQDYGIFYRQGPSISSLGNIPMTLFLNEIETDASVIATIPANQVSLVKIYSSMAGAWGNAPGGVLSIYTKKPEDYKGNEGLSNTLFYEGYSVVREFYAPDYRVAQPTGSPDHRITLDWRPSVFVNNINPRIPFSFYNNDRTQRFRVVVAGMTATGKLIWLEKIVAGK